MEKSTLERRHLNNLRIGLTHPVWDTVKSNRLGVMRAIIKVRLLTRTYLLQIHRKKFSLEEVVDAVWKRKIWFTCLHTVQRSARPEIYIWMTLSSVFGMNLVYPLGKTVLYIYASFLVQLIVDCQRLVPHILPDNKNLQCAIEVKAPMLCYKVHL